MHKTKSEKTIFRLTAIALGIQMAVAVSAAAAETTSDNIELDEVIVTGEKIERPIEETLSSVAVATSRDIEVHGDQSLTEVMNRTPGVYTQSRNDTWGIRGVPVSGFDDQGAQTLNNAISVYVDGALQTNRLITMSPLSLWDVKQVEIFRGSQSTIQGRNSLAGAVVIQTEDPQFKNSLSARSIFGNYGQQGGSVMGNAVLSPGVAAGRIALDYQTEDGYVDNETLNKDADSRRALNARGKLLVLPTDNSDLLITLAHTDYRMGDNAVSTSGDKPLYYELFANTDASDEVQQNEATLKYNYYFNNGWSITSITSGTHARYDSLLDFDQTSTGVLEVQRKHKTRLVNQEVRLGYEGDTTKGHVGVYYGKSEIDFNDKLTHGLFGLLIDADGNTEITSKAVFGEVNWYFHPQWQLIAGLRYDKEDNDSTLAYPVDNFGTGQPAFASQSQSFDALLPKLGLSYEFAPKQLLGFTVQRGYRSGGVNARPASGDFKPYDAEYTTNYELAYRGSWLNNKLKTFGNLYHTDWKDQQVASLDDTQTFTTVSNAARSEITGIELSFDYALTTQVNLFAGASYNDTEYKEYIDGNGDDLSGKSFYRAPKKKVNLGVTYRYSQNLFVNVDASYQDSSAAAYFPYRENDSVTLVNANVGYKINKNVSVNGFVRNLFDREYITNNQSGPVLDVGAPRTLGVVMRLDI